MIWLIYRSLANDISMLKIVKVHNLNKAHLQVGIFYLNSTKIPFYAMLLVVFLSLKFLFS